MTSVQIQNFTVRRNGIVRGGIASYTADPATGEISYSAEIYAGILFTQKTYRYSGTYTVDKSFLTSGIMIQNDGSHIVFGGMRFDFAKNIMSFNQSNFQGHVIFDLTNPFLKVISARATMKVSKAFGIDAIIDLDPIV